MCVFDVKVQVVYEVDVGQDDVGVLQQVQGVGWFQ